jgi:hypothetical protein
VIRPALSDDVPELVRMGCEFVDNSTYRMVMFSNPAQIASLMTSLIENDEGLLLVSETGDVEEPRHLSGMLGMMVYEHPLSHERVANEVFWWVNPEDRGRSDSVRLLRQGEQWAKEQLASLVYAGAPNQKVGSVFERLGYMPLEVQYVKPISAES